MTNKAPKTIVIATITKIIIIIIKDYYNKKDYYYILHFIQISDWSSHKAIECFQRYWNIVHKLYGHCMDHLFHIFIVLFGA